MVDGIEVFTTPGFHDVVMSNLIVSGLREVKVYLDGVLQLTSDTDQLNLDNVNNPGHLLHFFLDNALGGPTPFEYADGRIASLQLFDGIVDPTVPVPEPTSLALMLCAVVPVLARRIRRR